MNTYVLIVSILVGGQGVTQAWMQPDRQTCEVQKSWLVAKLAAKGISPLDSYCEAIHRVPSQAVPKSPPIQTALATPAVPFPKKKPSQAIPEKPKVETRPASVVSLKGCGLKKYRIINHQRRWYCKRRK